MGRDRAGERERDENSRATGGLVALVIEEGQRRLLLLPPFALRRSSERRSASRPAVFPRRGFIHELDSIRVIYLFVNSYLYQ